MKQDYKSPALKEVQNGTTASRDMKCGLINNLLENHSSDSMARSRVEQIRGPMPDEDWSKMKEIFRDFVLSDLKALMPPAPDIDQVPRLPGMLTGPDIDIYFQFQGFGDMFSNPSRRSSPYRPIQASTTSKPQPARQPSRSSPSSLPDAPSGSSARTDEATSGTKLTLPTNQAPEGGLDSNQDATAEICEERVFNNLNLTPEECLVAALQHKVPIWQGPEDDSSVN